MLAAGDFDLFLLSSFLDTIAWVWIKISKKKWKKKKEKEEKIG